MHRPTQGERENILRAGLRRGKSSPPSVLGWFYFSFSRTVTFTPTCLVGFFARQSTITPTSPSKLFQGKKEKIAPHFRSTTTTTNWSNSFVCLFYRQVFFSVYFVPEEACSGIFDSTPRNSQTIPLALWSCFFNVIHDLRFHHPLPWLYAHQTLSLTLQERYVTQTMRKKKVYRMVAVALEGIWSKMPVWEG